MLQGVFEKNQSEWYNGLPDQDTSKRDAIWLEKDVIVPLAGTNTAYVFQTRNWWSQVKTAGSAIYANRHYLSLYNKHNKTDRLTQHSDKGPIINGDVFIHPTAKVDPSAVLGPNVSIGKNVKVGAGTRIRESIILGNSVIGDHSLVIYSVIGWSSIVGDWSRVEGTPDDPDPNKPFAKMENNPLFNNAGQLNPSITILGGHVVVPSEVIILNSIVLPHKELTGSYKNQIIL
jgi:mannose-1-phosphate guanylyltransferase